MLISQQTLKKVGLPNRNFYLYADDHEFSLRIDDMEIPQYLVFNSKLKDLDISFAEGNSLFSPGVSDLKLFYSIRNHVYLSRIFVKKRSYYLFNKYVFLLLIVLRSLPFLVKDFSSSLLRLKLILRATSDGEAGRLGETY
jgi:hypothetical protein